MNTPRAALFFRVEWIAANSGGHFLELCHARVEKLH